MTQNQPSAMQVYLAMLTEQPERAETVLDEELLIAILAEIEALPSMWDYKGWQRQEENRYRVAAGVYGTTKRLITTAQVGWAYKKFKGDLKNRLKFSIVYKKHDTTETERYLRKWSLYNHLSFLRSTIRKEEAQYRAIAAKKPVKHQWMISLEKARAEAEELRKAKENSIQHQIQQGPPSDDVREVLQDQLVNSEPTESQNPVQQPTMPIGDHSSERSVQGAVKQKFQDNSSDLSPEKTRSQEPEAPSSTQRHYQWSIILWSDQDRDDWNSKSVYIEQSRASTAENRTRESVIRFGAHSSERPVQRGLKIAVTDEFPELFHTPERTSQDQCSSHAEITHEQTRLQQAPSSSQRPPCSRPSDNRVRESVIRFGTHSLERPVQRGIKIAVTDEFPELFHTPERTSQDQCSSHAEITHEQTRLQQAPSSSLEALMNQKPFNLSLHQSPPHTQSRQTQTERSIQQPPFIQCESCFSDEQGHDYQDFPRAQISHNRKSIWPHRSQELSQHRPSRNQLDHRAQGPVISQNNMRSPDSFGYRAQRPFNRYNDKFGSSCGTPGNDDVSPSTLRRQSRVQQTPHQEHQCAVENDKMLLKPIFAVAEQLVRRFPAQKSKELVSKMNELSPLQAYQALLENHPERAQPVINFELQKAILAEIRDLPRMWNHRGYPYQEENHLRVAVGVHAQTGKLITPAQVGWTYRSCKDALESRLELSILRKKHDSTQTEQYLEDWYLYPYVSFFRSTLMDQETRFRAKAAENAVKPQWMINYEMAQEAAEKFRNAKENCGENAALQRNSNQHQVQQGPPSDDVREVLQERQYQAPPPNQKPSNPPPVYHLVQPRFERSGADSSKRPSQGGLKWEIAEDVSKQIQVPKRRRHDLVSSQLDNQQCEALPPAQRPHRPSPMEHHSSERSGHKGIKREVTDKFPELFPTPERRSQDQDSSHIRINHDPTRSGRSRAPLPPQCPPFPRPGQSRIKIETLEEHPELFQTPERTLQEQDYSQLEALLNQKPRNMTLHQASPPHICHRRPSPLPVEHRPQEPFNCFATYSSDNQRDHYLTPPHDFPRPDSHLTYVRRSTSSQCLALQSNFLHEEDYNGYNNSASSSMHHGSSRGTPGMQTAVRQAQRQDQQRNVADDKEMLRGAFEMALEQTRTLPAHKFEQLMDVMMKTIELYRSM